MEDDVIDQTAAGYVELARRLEAYADLRLSPSSSATTRMRTAVMNAAHRRAALIQADATFDTAGHTASPVAAKRGTPALARLSWRRPVAALFAGVFALAVLAGSRLRRAGGRSALRRAPLGRDGQPAGRCAGSRPGRGDPARPTHPGGPGGIERGRRVRHRGRAGGLFVDRGRGRHGQRRGCHRRHHHRSGRHPTCRRPDRAGRQRPGTGTRGRRAGADVRARRHSMTSTTRATPRATDIPRRITRLTMPRATPTATVSSMPTTWWHLTRGRPIRDRPHRPIQARRRPSRRPSRRPRAKSRPRSRTSRLEPLRSRRRSTTPATTIRTPGPESTAAPQIRLARS